MGDEHARQVLGKRAAGRFQHIGLWRRCRAGGVLLLQILQRQLKLRDGRVQTLRGTAELHPSQLGDPRLQVRNLQPTFFEFRLLLRNRRRLRRDQRADVVRQGREVQLHRGMIDTRSRRRQ
jgi:hypothetical protein